MKLLFSMIISACCTVGANAQQNDALKNKLWEEFEKKKSSDDLKWKPRLNNMPSFLYPKQQQNNMVLKLPLKGTYTGKSRKDDEIYAMQPYNMPCLVPGKSFSSNMPVLGKSGENSSLLLEKTLQDNEEEKGRAL